MSRRWVLHMDMDAFFASVEQLTRPTLRDRAVLVGGLGPRATVAGASYQAREYGARSAMPMAEARRRCPVAVVLPPRFSVYHAVSKQVFTLVREVTDVMEQVSIDEAFLEPAELAGADHDTVCAFAEQLRARVREAAGVAASVGAGSGKQLAKIASGLAKPDGAQVIAAEDELGFLASLPVRKLWGIGPITEGKLHRIGVHTVGQLAALHIGDVTALLGQAQGTELHRLAHNVDEHPVAERAESKQVGAETTFDVDVTDRIALTTELVGMAEAAHRRLRESERAARTVTVKIKDAAFTTISRSETLPSATSDLPSLTAAVRRLVTVATQPGTPVRLVGVSYSGLSNAEQAPLFTNPVDHPEEPAHPHTTAGTARTGNASTLTAAGSETPISASANWRPGDDVRHPHWGHGWVQGAGHGRVTVRFETARTGPGKARTFNVGDAQLQSANPLASLA